MTFLAHKISQQINLHEPTTLFEARFRLPVVGGRASRLSIAVFHSRIIPLNRNDEIMAASDRPPHADDKLNPTKQIEPNEAE